MTFRKVTRFIFDLDGLLVNTEDLYTTATNMVLKDYQLTFPMSLKTRLMGRTSIEAATLLVTELGLPLTPQQYLDTAASYQNHLWSTAVEFMPGAKALLDYTFQHNIPCALATSSYRSIFVTKTKRLTPYFDKFRVIVCGDDREIKKGKPAPDLFLTAASKLGVDISSSEQLHQCLVFEDAPNGIEAANRAGMQSIWVPHSFMLESPTPSNSSVAQSPKQLEYPPTCTVSSLLAFKPELFGLPAFSEQ